MATEYTYLLERQMSHIPKHGTDVVTLKHQSIDGCITKRKFWPTLAGGKPVYIDVTTGTFYDAATGERSSVSPQGRIVLDAEATVTRKRKDVRARESEGWMNEARRVAA